MPFLVPFCFTLCMSQHVFVANVAALSWRHAQNWTSLGLARGTAFRALQMSCHTLETWFIDRSLFIVHCSLERKSIHGNAVFHHVVCLFDNFQILLVSPASPR